MSKKKVVKKKVAKKKVDKAPVVAPVKKPDISTDDTILQLIKEVISITDRRFNINVIYRYCLERSILKNFHDLEDIFKSLEKKKLIYNIGGASWITPKPKRVRS